MQNHFHLPFTSRGINPHAKIVTERSIQWVQNTGLLASFPKAQKYKTLLIGELVARTHPTFTLEELQLVADWSMWLFINDDLFDKLPFNTLQERIERYQAILYGERAWPSDTPFTCGLADLWQRTRPLVSDAWVARFCQNLGQHLESSLWESLVKSNNHAPDVATYLQMRQITSGIDAYVDLLDIGTGFVLPAAVQYSPPVQRLVQMVNNITSWANEVWSVAKEMAQGDSLLNMVWLYHHNENISIEQALQKVSALCQAEIDVFAAQIDRLPTFGAQVDQQLQRYVLLLQDIVHGTLEWHFVTDRYRKHWQESRMQQTPVVA